MQRFLEAVAAILGVDSGRRRLEVVFEDGQLVQWRVAREANSPSELARFDEEASWLVVRSGAL